VSKRTLYQHFPSKNDLVDNYLRGFDARGGSPNERRLEDTDLSARDRLLAIFEMSSRDVLRGCPFHNAAVESAGSLTSTDEIVRVHKVEFTRRLVAVAQEAGAADPHLLGQQLAVLFEGATAMATSLNDTAPVVHARAAAATLIDAALSS
jgi:AcrR family transcriptional regulator